MSFSKFLIPKSLLSQNISVRTLIEQGGDIHHIFPKQYLIDNKYDKNLYNQDANYAFLDTPMNVSIGKKSPSEYFRLAFDQCSTGKIVCGSITDLKMLKENMAMNCIPEDIIDMTHENYRDFLEKRRLLMAQKIKDFYYSL